MLAIEIESLYCGYSGKDVLQGIDLTFETGEMAAILGPNGSGKTTLLLALAGVLRPHAGRIRLAGRESQRNGARWRARRVASVPQRGGVAFPFRCLTVVLMGRYPHLQGWGGYSEKDVEIAVSVMQQTDILPLAQRRMDEVSGGESQMVLIARALAQSSDILLLDEATSSLDARRKMQVFDLLCEKNRSGATILCSMHDLNLAALYCQRLVFLKNGAVVLDGPREEIFTDDRLSAVYETEVKVSRHPTTGAPQAHFVPGRGMSAADAAVERSGGPVPIRADFR